jgi:hypothetical protein
MGSVWALAAPAAKAIPEVAAKSQLLRLMRLIG